MACSLSKRFVSSPRLSHTFSLNVFEATLLFLNGDRESSVVVCFSPNRVGLKFRILSTGESDTNKTSKPRPLPNASHACMHAWTYIRQQHTITGCCCLQVGAAGPEVWYLQHSASLSKSHGNFFELRVLKKVGQIFIRNQILPTIHCFVALKASRGPGVHQRPIQHLDSDIPIIILKCSGSILVFGVGSREAARNSEFRTR